MSNDARCPPYLPPFTTSPFPISGRWGTVPLNLLLRLLRYCYAEYHNTRIVVTASPRVIILSPLFIISFRFNHYITVFSNLYLLHFRTSLDFVCVYIYRPLFCRFIGQECLVSFLSVDYICQTHSMSKALTIHST